MTALLFTIDGAPEGKRRPRASSRHGVSRIHSDPADIARETLIRRIVRDAMSGRDPFTGPVRVTIEAVFEVPKSYSKARRSAALDGVWHTSKPDLDNIEKSVLDGLMPEKLKKAAPDGSKYAPPFCLIDDAQVAELRSAKRWGTPARVVVRIDSLAGTGAGRLL